MTMRPLHNNVIVKRAENSSFSAGGIALIDNKKTNDAFVVAVSDKVDSVKVGDKVVLDGQAKKINRFFNENAEYYVVDDDDIMGVYEDA